MTETEERLQTAVALLAPWQDETETPEENRIDVVVQAEELVAAVTALLEAKWGYLAAITGLDLGAEAATLEALYHFCAGTAVVTLRVRVPYADAAVPTVCGVIPSAMFYERELEEMLGIKVRGASYEGHLFLPEGWPDNVYPLRKDYVITGATGTK